MSPGLNTGLYADLFQFSLSCAYISNLNRSYLPPRKVKRQKISTESHSSHVGGVVFALCCHHRCNWPHYVGREFMTELGLGPDEFHLLCCLSSWATCGMGLKRSKGETSQNHCEEGNMDDLWNKTFLTTRVYWDIVFAKFLFTYLLSKVVTQSVFYETRVTLTTTLIFTNHKDK